MKEHHLKALVQVAESASISAAARAMNLSQSALTKALRELEESVGAELLNRSYRGIEFTTAGKVLLQSAFGKLDLVSRDEFDSQMVVLARTRSRLETLEAKVAELEAKLSSTDTRSSAD